MVKLTQEQLIVKSQEFIEIFENNIRTIYEQSGYTLNVSRYPDFDKKMVKEEVKSINGIIGAIHSLLGRFKLLGIEDHELAVKLNKFYNIYHMIYLINKKKTQLSRKALWKIETECDLINSLYDMTIGVE